MAHQRERRDSDQHDQQRDTHQERHHHDDRHDQHSQHKQREQDRWHGVARRLVEHLHDGGDGRVPIDALSGNGGRQRVDHLDGLTGNQQTEVRRDAAHDHAGAIS
ncbi:hypothetical protein ACFQX7_28345 [Luedemannella flava]